MAIRTTSVAVAGIIEVDVAISLDPFIETASALLDRVFATYDTPYPASYEEIIERWLAAHFYAVRDNRKDSEKADVVSEKNMYEVDLGFNVTIYGQQALALDDQGGLAAIQDGSQNGTLGGKISSCWLGTEAS